MRYVIPLLVLTLITHSLEAQNCRKGIPCGHSCISASKTCRIGSSQPASEPAVEPMPRYVVPSNTASTEAQPWLGQPHGRIYYRASCQAAKELPEPIYFKTEEDAQRLGYRRSQVPGC
jgi:hypothetical protein